MRTIIILKMETITVSIFDAKKWRNNFMSTVEAMVTAMQHMVGAIVNGTNSEEIGRREINKTLQYIGVQLKRIADQLEKK